MCAIIDSPVYTFNVKCISNKGVCYIIKFDDLYKRIRTSKG